MATAQVVMTDPEEPEKPPKGSTVVLNLTPQEARVLRTIMGSFFGDGPAREITDAIHLVLLPLTDRDQSVKRLSFFVGK